MTTYQTKTVNDKKNGNSIIVKYQLAYTSVKPTNIQWWFQDSQGNTDYGTDTHGSLQFIIPETVPYYTATHFVTSDWNDDLNGSLRIQHPSGTDLISFSSGFVTEDFHQKGTVIFRRNPDTKPNYLEQLHKLDHRESRVQYNPKL